MKALLLSKNWSYFIALSFLTYALFSFKNNELEAAQSTLLFEEISRKIDTISQTDEDIKFEIVFDDSELFIDINLETELCILTGWDKNIKTEFNYTYDTSLESSLEAIKVLKSKVSNDIIVLLPTFSEEFFTCQLILIERDSKAFRLGVFEINTHKYNNVSYFYLNNNMKLTQNKDHFKIKLGDFKYEQDFKK